MTRIIAIANQKGGVAKTTTVASIGAALAELGQRVLVVDLDPQACLTFSLGLDPETLEFSMHDVLLGRISASMAVFKTDEDMHLLPASIDLAGTEAQLLTRTGREFSLRTALEDIAGEYDTILLDCSPSLGVLTINALTAANEVLIPLQCETLSHRGVGQLLDTIADVRRITNRDLVVLGRAAHPVRLADQPLTRRAGRHQRPLRPGHPRPGHPALDPLRRGARRGAFGAVVRWPVPRRGGLPAARARTCGRDRRRGTDSPDGSKLMSNSTFDRVRTRAVTEPTVAGVDVQGKSALFSRDTVNPSLGSVVITCSDCHVATVASYARALHLALPSVHLLVVRRDYPSWMRCPACDERHWVRVRFH